MLRRPPLAVMRPACCPSLDLRRAVLATGRPPCTSHTCWPSRAITGYPPGPGAPSAPMSWPPAAPAGLAAAVSRRRRQGPPALRLGLGHDQPPRPRLPLPADPPEPADRGTGLLPLLLSGPGPLATLVKVAGLR